MNILHDSVVDGDGIRTVIFFAGCSHFCRGCHNPRSWNIKNGTDMTVQDVLDEVLSNPLTDVTFSGGDPFFQAHEVKNLAKELKAHGKNIWMYTGYTLKEIKENEDPSFQELLSYSDVLVDGRFEQDKKDLTLKFRGSSNQTIIKRENFNLEVVED